MWPKPELWRGDMARASPGNDNMLIKANNYFYLRTETFVEQNLKGVYFKAILHCYSVETLQLPKSGSSTKEKKNMQIVKYFIYNI